jgi:hypothetical protein
MKIQIKLFAAAREIDENLGGIPKTKGFNFAFGGILESRIRD